MSRPRQPQPLSFFVGGYTTVAAWVAATGSLSYLATSWHAEVAALAFLTFVAAVFTARELSLATLERAPVNEAPKPVHSNTYRREPLGRTGLSSRRIS